ncbi:glycosyltransferase (plasmid) [Natrinema thermotolerans]|uniref:Glycosyltransferase n=1 Tax=Natrinema thermotolerans TaxID=121872 RepID=A0AAF0PFQ6_9EURY|nr:glycosyltransferase [Natrinema thermotolerans]QCC57142.1 glycosyltransferase family 2 protein [Natrinema thermotolerans]WMT10300.1 glycosyltransferase [Natrinema thermotolerans]
MRDSLTARGRTPVVACLATLVPYILLGWILPRERLFAIATYAVVLGVYLGWSYYVVERRPAYRQWVSPSLLGLVLTLCTISVVALEWVPLSAIALVHLGALTVIFCYWLIPFAALYQAVTTRDEFEDISEYPSITVLVPAYNEEGYVGRTVAALLGAAYPDGKKEIIVIDDGSTDGTYEEACRYESDTVTVVSKENGGKYSALNYGLLFAESEIVVTVDADSIVETDALREIVAPFVADPMVGAVASNVRIFNRDSFVANCQVLEYVFGINVFRRTFDQFSAVSVVPGCLGAYRRDVLDEVNAYDPHTLTEDFDTTLKVLRQGYKVRFSKAVVYTEAPDTWRDLYKQRLRWYRGNLMTLRKHLFNEVQPSNRYLNRIHLPFALLTMIISPLAGIIILGSIGYMAITGGFVTVLLLATIYTSLIALLNALAISIEGESYWYLIYTPLFVVGYKQFHDFVMLKSCIDIIRGTELGWTNVSRVDQRDRPELRPERQSD